jgi:rubrerythrin
MFRAAAEAETVHALNHLKALKAVKSTRENLGEAISGETHEFTKMYPAMIGDAKSEGNQEALKTFQWANAVEEVHARLYKGLLDNLGKAVETYPYYVCPVCGYTHEKEAPETCPVCGTKGKFFKRID